MRNTHGSTGLATPCRWAALVGLAVLVAGCAIAPLPPERALDAGDLGRLAGTWQWSSWLDSPARLGSGPMTVRLEGGRLAFTTRTTTGTLTLHEGPARRVLKGQGIDDMGRQFAVQLTQSGPAPAGATAGVASGVAFILVVQ